MALRLASARVSVAVGMRRVLRTICCRVWARSRRLSSMWVSATRLRFRSLSRAVLVPSTRAAIGLGFNEVGEEIGILRGQVEERLLGLQFLAEMRRSGSIVRICRSWRQSGCSPVSGIGGGFLIVPGLMRATGMPILNAVGSSLVAVTAFGLTTAINYSVSGLVNWTLAGIFIGGGVLGGIAGVAAAKMLGSRRGVLNIVFAATIKRTISHSLQALKKQGRVRIRGGKWMLLNARSKPASA